VSVNETTNPLAICFLVFLIMMVLLICIDLEHIALLAWSIQDSNINHRRS
jgi:NADH:ubiquinone oxidoreductase subunit 3 (subunit A)